MGGMKDLMEDLLEEAIMNGYITCPDCGNHLEIDAEQCCCGWENIAQI